MTKSVTAGSCCTGVLIVGSLLSYILCVALNAVLNIPGISECATAVLCNYMICNLIVIL